ncbi:type II secretion system protein M (plasmid) [Escherichia coli O170:H18]|uniref:type II secretion system protein GspM n=1 Tax=Escherichia coli TaxID=562 RepID=UPI001C1F46C9|nr:type II secretion system protein M [Escherichia coli]EKY6398838.1 type II secretion system protein M [Escherichia coli]QWV76969.1 type II secretion system protein M [Escherichia coli O170:H18]
MNKLKKRLQQLSVWERVLASGCCAMLIVCLGYNVLWLPWQLREEKWQNIIIREKNTVEWIKEQIPRIQSQKVSSQQNKSLSLSAAITGSSSSYGVTITRLQHQGELLIVSLAPIEFNNLMQWITQLELQYQIYIVTFDVTAQDNRAGWVAINRLILMRNKSS